MIAQATIKKYRHLPVAGPTSDESSTADDRTCSLPENIVLEWKREQLSLDVVLKDVKVNQFDASQRAARFVEPTPSGYARVNLAEVARQKDPEARRPSGRRFRCPSRGAAFALVPRFRSGATTRP